MSLGFRSTIASSFHENSSECPARWSDAALSAQRGSRTQSQEGRLCPQLRLCRKPALVSQLMESRWGSGHVSLANSSVWGVGQDRVEEGRWSLVIGASGVV